MTAEELTIAEELAAAEELALAIEPNDKRAAAAALDSIAAILGIPSRGQDADPHQSALVRLACQLGRELDRIERHAGGDEQLARLLTAQLLAGYAATAAAAHCTAANLAGLTPSDALQVIEENLDKERR